MIDASSHAPHSWIEWAGWAAIAWGILRTLGSIAQGLWSGRSKRLQSIETTLANLHTDIEVILNDLKHNSSDHEDIRNRLEALGKQLADHLVRQT